MLIPGMVQMKQRIRSLIGMMLKQHTMQKLKSTAAESIRLNLTALRTFGLNRSLLMILSILMVTIPPLVLLLMPLVVGLF